MSLMDVYQELVSADEEVAGGETEKQAAAQAEVETAEDPAETVKLAHGYDEAGRALARTVFAGMMKEAAEAFGGEETAAEEKKEEEAEEKAEGGEKKKDEKKKDKAELMEEKKASILARMKSDPAFAQAMIQRHGG